jgi:hypothetical protein
MKKFIVFVVIAFSVFVIVKMSLGEQASLASHAQIAQAAEQTRPRDLEMLKRLSVKTACAKHTEWDMATCQTMDAREVSLGMTADQIRLSWGKPEKINTTTTARREHEQWVYGQGQYLYVDNGVLKSMQGSK